MSSKNKFGFAPIEAEPGKLKRERSVGPMGVAVREAAESLQTSTEAKVEQRHQNAQDAKAYRAAEAEGRVLVNLPLNDISTDDLPRDRLALEAVAHSDEMEELKASIRERGQKEPVEVYRGEDGRYQLKKGWRRFTALSQLSSETGDIVFNTIVARVEIGSGDRMARYIDMVEENVIREDLTFAEMAQVAITAAQDDQIDEADPANLVSRFYGALHKTKKSYIRSFVLLLVALGDTLRWPKTIPRNLGVDVARCLKTPDQVEQLRSELEVCADAGAQNAILARFVDDSKKMQAEISEKQPTSKRKFEFFVEGTKVTARAGELRIVSASDYASIPKEKLEEAVIAFESVLNAARSR